MFMFKIPKMIFIGIIIEVYTKISYIEKVYNVTRITATSYLNQLEDAELLVSEKIGREKIYKNVRLIELLASN